MLPLIFKASMSLMCGFMSIKDSEKFDHKNYLATLTRRPGVYRMIDAKGTALYIGKARNLRNRVGSYFRASGLASKTMAMVKKIAAIEITVTNSDTEALLLEQSLIKELRPSYNIQLRDDKSYPYILLTEPDTYPRLAFYRGSRKRSGRFFGPYPSASATRETLQVLQKVFRVRQCEDSYFKNRSRPCLQYQIKRCTAPCVKLINQEAYAQDVHHSMLFLRGKSDVLIRELTTNMESAAAEENFERAAAIRDQISDLRKIQEQQFVANQGNDADVLAAELRQSYVCIHAIYIRAGRIIGSKGFYPRFKLAMSPSDVLSAFIAQNYLGDNKSVNIPAEIIVPAALDDGADLQLALSYVAGRKVKLAHRVRGHRAKWIELAQTNATQSLEAYVNGKKNIKNRFSNLRDTLNIDSQIYRIECFDISHTAGEGAVASCVVFDERGAIKGDYRRFNISGITRGDDYGAMEQALDRRFTRLTKGEGKMPDILLIDGGKGQLSQAKGVLEKFSLPEICLLGIAKGVSRRAGQETLYIGTETGYRRIAMPPESPALLLLQQIRDEAHRFAITSHRQRRAKARKQSLLEAIPGLGPKRRQELIKHFGGHQQIRKASQTEIAKVSGISKKLAENIYTALHNN